MANLLHQSQLFRLSWDLQICRDMILGLGLDNFLCVQLVATVCTTLGCLLNGTAIAYTGPALPSLLNITGDPGDGTDIWTENIVINAQEASWISESG